MKPKKKEGTRCGWMVDDDSGGCGWMDRWTEGETERREEKEPGVAALLG